MTVLSELEGVTLGIIIKEECCTAYKIRKKLEASPSSHWRASAGAIYPLVSRLAENKLVNFKCDNEDGRGTKLFKITPKGKREFTRWIKNIHQDDLILKISDPLRTRIFFLDSLDKEAQLEFVKKAIASVKSQLIIAERHKSLGPESADMFEYLGAKAGLIHIEGRLKLLRILLDKLETA